MFLILTSMSVLNLLTKYTSTPKISFMLFPWPLLFPSLSFLCEEIAPVFLTGREMPDCQYMKGLVFNLTITLVASTVMCLWVEHGYLVEEMLSQLVPTTKKSSYISNPTLKVTMTNTGDNTNKVMSSGKEEFLKVTPFL